MSSSDPSICTNIFAIFHCFTISTDAYGEEIAYIMSDFRYLCGGDFYAAHVWLGLLFVLLYPIGIPMSCGIVIFRQRAAIKKGKGPSAFKQLYEDYKPEHCLCVA